MRSRVLHVTGADAPVTLPAESEIARHKAAIRVSILRQLLLDDALISRAAGGDVAEADLRAALAALVRAST